MADLGSTFSSFFVESTFDEEEVADDPDLIGALERPLFSSRFDETTVLLITVLVLEGPPSPSMSLLLLTFLTRIIFFTIFFFPFSSEPWEGSPSLTFESVSLEADAFRPTSFFFSILFIWSEDVEVEVDGFSGLSRLI